MLALVKSERGDIVEKLGQDFVIEGRIADLDATRQRRVSFVRRVALPPGRYSVETAVRDGLGDRTGCNVTRLVVALPVPGVRLSSVVGLAGATAATGEDRDDPFRVGQVQMAPDLGGRLHADAGSDGLAVYWPAYRIGASPAGASSRPRVWSPFHRLTHPALVLAAGSALLAVRWFTAHGRADCYAPDEAVRTSGDSPRAPEQPRLPSSSFDECGRASMRGAWSAEREKL